MPVAAAATSLSREQRSARPCVRLAYIAAATISRLRPRESDPEIGIARQADQRLPASGHRLPVQRDDMNDDQQREGCHRQRNAAEPHKGQPDRQRNEAGDHDQRWPGHGPGSCSDFQRSGSSSATAFFAGGIVRIADM